MFKLAIKLAIIAAIAHAGIKIVPQFWAYASYKDKLAELGRYHHRRTVDDLNYRAMKSRTELGVPVETPVSWQRRENLTIIDTQWTAQLEYLPKQYYPWQFTIHLEEAPQRYDGYIP
jgi:hypothetical protein